MTYGATSAVVDNNFLPSFRVRSILVVHDSSASSSTTREHHSTGLSLSTTRPVQQYNEDLDNFRNNSKLAIAQENPYALPQDHPDHVNNLLNCCDADTHTLLHSMDSLILSSMAKPQYTSIDMPPVYPYPSTNAVLQGELLEGGSSADDGTQSLDRYHVML